MQDVFSEVKEKIGPAVDNTVKVLKVIVIAIIGLADILILQLVLIIFNSSNTPLALLFTQIFMTVFFILPSIVIFRFPISITGA